MEVRRATHGGACYGVKRALDLARAAVADGRQACTLGPLIHNPGVVAELEEQGIHVIGEDDIPQSGAVIIRSHGITPDKRQRIEATGLPLIDATCPHVSRAQSAAAELGRKDAAVIVVGEEGHPEVEGLRAYAKREGAFVTVVSRPEDIPADCPEPVGVVVQTTQKKAVFDAIVKELDRRGLEPQVKNTICSATRLRQEEAADLAGAVDAMVVIGGRNSSNTTRLAEICRSVCSDTFHIESAEELDPSWFSPGAVVGVTAGASTPEGQIDAVIERLRKLP